MARQRQGVRMRNSCSLGDSSKLQKRWISAMNSQRRWITQADRSPWQRVAQWLARLAWARWAGGFGGVLGGGGGGDSVPSGRSRTRKWLLHHRCLMPVSHCGRVRDLWRQPMCGIDLLHSPVAAPCSQAFRDASAGAVPPITARVIIVPTAPRSPVLICLPSPNADGSIKNDPGFLMAPGSAWIHRTTRAQ